MEPAPKNVIAEIEEDLRRSQFSEWDAERFISERDSSQNQPEDTAKGPDYIGAVKTFLYETWVFFALFGLTIMAGKLLGIWNGLS